MPLDPHDPLLPIGDGHTLLDDDSRRGLRLHYITTRDELNEAEQANILRAVARARPPTIEALLDDLYLRRLHQRMFRDVWTWAGKYRTRETNIGIAPARIPTALRDLTQDARAWIAAPTETPDAIAVRFHHRLVQIHPFANGNGRHARIAANYLILALARPAFTWGATLPTPDVRAAYIEALRAADQNNLTPLTTFART